MVNGVKGAAAVITGKTIYLGLDLQANLNKNKVKNVENMVLNRVKKSQPTYSITVTSDIDTVTRIKKVARGIAQGKPVTSFTRELQDIGSRIKPRMK